METEATVKSGDSANISSLRSAIDAKLHEDGVYQQIRELILQKAPASASEPLDNRDKPSQTIDDDLIREVLQSEFIQQLLEAIKLKPPQVRNGDEDDDKENESLPINEPTLFLRLAGGRAFVDQLVSEDDAANDDGVASITSHQVGLVRSFFRVVVSFQGQRLSSSDVPCTVDPAFNEHFRFRIAKKTRRPGRTKTGGLYEIEVVSPWEALCLVDEPVHLVLVKITKQVVSGQPSTGPVWRELRRELVAVHRFDWRRVLSSTLQLVHVPIQLVDNMKVPVGTLDVRLDLLHFQRTAAIAKDVTAFLSKEALEHNTLRHAFYRYAQEWWKEYRNETEALDINTRRAGDDLDLDDRRLLGRSRLVKLFAEDDDGKFRMVCKFLCPLRAPLAVRSPNEAARFVSLLPHEPTASVGGVADEAWQSIATTLAIGKGDTPDHAVLLASLLLGCGLDAYVCIGTVLSAKRRGTKKSNSTSSHVGHVWVMTRDPDRPHDVNGVLFWDSITGEHHRVGDGTALRHGFVSVDCAFSATLFFANLQPRHFKLSESSFHLDDDTAWKALDARRIADLPSATLAIVLTPPDVTAVLPLEQQWQASLQRMLSSHRRTKGLTTKWSDELSLYLQPALNSYELERLYHVPQLENDLFQQTIKRFVTEGSTFQAVPFMFRSSVSVEHAVETLVNHAIAQKILTIQGRGATFGLAVRGFPYPEHLCVLWIMLAVSYQT